MKRLTAGCLHEKKAFIFGLLLPAVYMVLPLAGMAQETLQSVTNNGGATSNAILLTSDSIGLSVVSPATGTAKNTIRLGNAASSGTGGYIQGTVTNANDGYGIWINQNAYYDYSKANYVQPRGTLGSYLYTVNYHKGFAWYYAAANGVNGNTVIPVQVASLSGSGTFAVNSLILNAGINLSNTTYGEKRGIIFKNGSGFISDFNYGNNGTVTTAGGNTFLGVNAGNFTMGSTATSAVQASYNTGIGTATLNRNTTGYKNTAVGYAAFEYNTTGANNTAIGFEALINNTTGNYNTANGYAALVNNTTANNNTATGYMTLFENTTGTNNTAMGFNALYKNSTGNNNTTTGYAALLNNTTGSANVASGFQAGRYISDGSTADTASSSSVFIGSNTKSLAAADNNEIVIGYGATGAGSNSVVLGNTSVTKTLLQGNVGIGTSAPQSRLAVNGTVTATQVKVTQTGWPDYVFDTAYRLLALKEVSGFIRQHKHLPELPSAKEITENGLDLGHMQKTQMQKIEELTLYLIRQNEIVEQQAGMIEALSKRVAQLEKRLSK